MSRFSRLNITRAISFFLLVIYIGNSTLTVESGTIRTAQATPPFSGTIFLDPDIITASDPTTFEGAPYAGQGMRTMFDRRVNNWVTVNAYLFNASFDDGLTAEIQINPEFGSSAAASVEAQKYGNVIGQLPLALRADVQTVWIHLGVQPFGGGNNNILIHTGQTALYEADGILEETLVHEAAHTSLDAAHASAPNWLAAQTADGTFISTYAQDNPIREDIAESFLPYLALRYRLGRISQQLADTFTQTIPNRMAYFDSQSFEMYPLLPIPDLVARDDLVLTPMDTSATIHPLSNDGDPNSDPIMITAFGSPTSGAVSLASTHFVYTPTLGFLGTDVFTYTISTSAENDTATVSVVVAAEIFRLFLPLTQR